MKESFGSQRSLPEEEIGGAEDGPVPEATAVETAIFLSQSLLSLFEPGVLPEELAKRSDYLRDAEALLASADLKDESARKLLKESIAQAQGMA